MVLRLMKRPFPPHPQNSNQQQAGCTSRFYAKSLTKFQHTIIFRLNVHSTGEFIGKL